MTTTRARWLAVAAVATLFAIGWARAGAEPQATPEVTRVPSTGHVGIEGQQTFAAYCAPCHGADARGHGPAAPALKMPVPDLTTLAKRHGSFQAARVDQTIRGTNAVPAAHGTLTMPIWGPIFRAAASDDRAVTTLRVTNLVGYLRSIQEK